MSRAAKVALTCLVVTAAAGGGVAIAMQRTSSSHAAATDATVAKTATATVDQRDLITYDETTATLGFTASATVSSPVAGTVTSIVASGDAVGAGSVVATVDGEPVVAFIGDIPSYRDLDVDSSDGPDIRQLETNLVALGFDPFGYIDIDETFDSATEDSVTLWEQSIGLDGDGTVPEGRIVNIPGRLLVDSVSAGIGNAVQAGSSLLTARVAERRFPIAATIGDGGTIDHIAEVGTPVTTGTVLFWQSGNPVVAIEGDAAAIPALDRDLSIEADNGSDVELLERMLVAGGFDPEGNIVVDDQYDQATASSVIAWLSSFGITPTSYDPVLPAGSYVVVPAGLFVGTANVADGAATTTDQPVLSLTTAAREVTTSAPIGDDTFALGAEIDVEFPDGTIQPGTVVSVGNVASNTSNVPGSTPTVTITIHVDDIPASVDSFVQIPVTLRVVAESAMNAFVVPVSALVALAEGGDAIEVVTGKHADGTDATTLIGVETGLFADGFVAITGDQLRTGLTVVVPS